MFGGKKQLDDYVVETVEHNGKPKERSVYIGAYVAYDNPKLANRLKAFLTAVAVYIVASFLACGFSAFHNNVFYVLVPYVLQTITAGLYVIAVIELLSYGVLMKSHDRDKTIGRMRPICFIHAALAAIAAVGDVFFVAFDPAYESMTHECVFVVFNILAAFAAVFATAAANALDVHETENPDRARIEKKREEQKELDFLLELERKEKIKAQSRAANEAKNKNKKKKKK